MRKISYISMVLALIMPLSSQAALHSEGQNVLSNGTIYMISGGELRPYTSAGAFLSYGFNNWNNVVQASSEDLALPIGSFIPPRDGKVVCSDRGVDRNTCYLITNGQKSGFVSEKVFTDLGYNFKYVLTGDVSFLPSAENISDSSKAHLPGTLVNDQGTVKLISDSGTVGVPDMATLNSWGYSLIDVVPANEADKSLTQVAVLPTYTPGQLRWDGKSGVSDGNLQLPSDGDLADICINIEGVQTQVPAGLVNQNGNCVVPVYQPPVNEQSVLKAPYSSLNDLKQSGKVTLDQTIGYTSATFVLKKNGVPLHTDYFTFEFNGQPTTGNITGLKNNISYELKVTYKEQGRQNTAITVPFGTKDVHSTILCSPTYPVKMGVGQQGVNTSVTLNVNCQFPSEIQANSVRIELKNTGNFPAAVRVNYVETHSIPIGDVLTLTILPSNNYIAPMDLLIEGEIETKILNYTYTFEGVEYTR